MATLNPFTPVRRLVVKIGSALLVDVHSGKLRTDWLKALGDDIARLHKEGVQIVIVSSGAIALGRGRLGLSGQSLNLSEKQACAATGQSSLTQAYEKSLAPHRIITAQALLTLNDTENRRRWLNARSTLGTLLSMGAVPIINENDTVATDEIRFGDNDRLAARTAQMLGADTLILLSDIDGLYDRDPRTHETACHMSIVEAVTPEIMAMGGAANAASSVGTGGMVTKLAAARIATQAGCYMCIMNGEATSPLTRLENGATCTWFKAASNPIDARRQWIKGALKSKGTITIDGGAVRALGKGKSLLAAGVTAIEGAFQKGDSVSVSDTDGREVARGLIAYDADEARKIMGLNSSEIDKTLGYNNGAALIHRDNMVMRDIE